MEQRFFNTADLVATEAEVRSQTHADLRTFLEGYSYYTDVLLRIPLFCERGESNGPETPEGLVFAVAWHRYVLAPSACRSLALLFEAGHYDQAVLVLRHLYEVFVQLRYFDVHKDQLEGHLKARRSKDRVQFRKMFDEIAPGFYDDIYSPFSSFAHGGIAAGLFRTEYLTDRTRVTKGSRFDQRGANYLLNSTVPVVSGFLRYAPKFFPSFAVLADKETEAMRLRALEHIDRYREGHRADLPNSEEWHEKLDCLVR